MADARSQDVELRYIDDSGQDVTTTLGRARGELVVRGRPVREFPTYPGQHNYPGWLWTATTSSLIGYESLLERDRLWMADFDPQVRWIASQPFWMSGRDGSGLRRHVPDFLLETDRGWLVVDVKPSAMLEHPKVAEQLAWCGQLCADRRWSYEVWSGVDPVVLRNVRFLAAGRRGWATDADLLADVARHALPGRTLGQVADLTGAGDQGAWPASHARAALLALLWCGTCRVDMTKPLGPDSRLLGVAA
jgi:hypothetical protein